MPPPPPPPTHTHRHICTRPRAPPLHLTRRVPFLSFCVWTIQLLGDCEFCPPLPPPPPPFGQSRLAPDNTRTHARTHTHTHARARTHAQARTSTHARTHARTHAHTHWNRQSCDDTALTARPYNCFPWDEFLIENALDPCQQESCREWSPPGENKLLKVPLILW